MNKPEIKIIDTYPSDNSQITAALCDGYRLIQAVPYMTSYFNQRQAYTEIGGTYTIYEKQSETAMIKYILERDNITKLLHG